VEAIDDLYVEGAAFSSHPFRTDETARAYVEWVFAGQESAECRFGEPIAAGDEAAVAWYGVVTSRDGSVETLAGVSLLRFDEDGLVVGQRDVWSSARGRHELPAWAG
jgi:hypothetical protein